VADSRSRRAKLAAMAAQSASPREAEIARRLLETTPPSRTLDRDAILGQPNERAGVRSYRVWEPSRGVWLIVDEDDTPPDGPGVAWVRREGTG
jgi:hypothetical protein